MIISTHIPKTGGSTFYNLLINYYQDSCCLDHLEQPLAYRYCNKDIPNNLPTCFNTKTTSIIHGHFLTRKYKAYNGNHITWLRNPVERVASHYYYWKRHPDPKHIVYRHMLKEQLLLEEFSKLACLKNFQSFFLNGFNIEDFSFIGITEQFDKSIQLFCKMHGIDQEFIPKKAIRSNPDKDITSKYDLSDNLRNELEEFHSEDMVLYKKAVTHFEIFCQEYGV